MKNFQDIPRMYIINKLIKLNIRIETQRKDSKIYFIYKI